jgi:hypothetical protein
MPARALLHSHLFEREQRCCERFLQSAGAKARAIDRGEALLDLGAGGGQRDS